MAAIISDTLIELDASRVLRLPQFPAAVSCYPSTIPSGTSDSPVTILVAVDGRFTKDYSPKTQVVLSGELSAGQDGNSLVVLADQLRSPDQCSQDPSVLVVATVCTKDTELDRHLTIKTRGGMPNALTIAWVHFHHSTSATLNSLACRIPATGLIGKDYQAVRIGYMAVVKGTISSLRHLSSGKMVAVLAPTRYYRFFPAIPTPGVGTIKHDFPQSSPIFGKVPQLLDTTNHSTTLVRSRSVCGFRGCETEDVSDFTSSDDEYRAQ